MLILVKIYRVFSSGTNFLEYSPKFQFHKIKKNDRKWVVKRIHAGLYLLAKEFRYITILRIILLFTKHYKENQKFLLFIDMAWSTDQIIYFFIKIAHNFVFLINSRPFKFSMHVEYFIKRVTFFRSYSNILPSSIFFIQFNTLVL